MRENNPTLIRKIEKLLPEGVLTNANFEKPVTYKSKGTHHEVISLTNTHALLKINYGSRQEWVELRELPNAVVFSLYENVLYWAENEYVV